MSQRGKSNKSSRGEELRKDIPIVEHTWATEQLFKHFNIDGERGLTEAQVLLSRSRHGLNQLTPPKQIPGRLVLLAKETTAFRMDEISSTISEFLCYFVAGRRTLLLRGLRPSKK